MQKEAEYVCTVEGNPAEIEAWIEKIARIAELEKREASFELEPANDMPELIRVNFVGNEEVRRHVDRLIDVFPCPGKRFFYNIGKP